jgi:hypothetical protein
MPIITKALPSQERLRELFDYDADTGNLIWKVRPVSHFRNQRGCKFFNAMFAGKVAGCINKGDGYRTINVNRVLYFAHRLVYAYFHGACPVDLQIDHIDCVRLNNRIQNLRLATHAENGRNSALRRTSNSGYRGVHWSKQNKKFVAKISTNGRKKHLGSFPTAEQAAAAYTTAAIALHGEFVHPSVLAHPQAPIAPPTHAQTRQLSLLEAT